MLLELIATFAAGFAAAGAVMIVNLTTGNRLPKWIMPALAGLAMIGYTIWSEYSWYDRAVAGLPEGIEVTSPQASTALWRPWTYVAPLTERFAAIDRASIQTHPDHPDQMIVDMLFYARWSAPQLVPVAFDCAASTRALLGEGVSVGEDGTLEGAIWVELAQVDPTLRALCPPVAADAAKEETG